MSKTLLFLCPHNAAKSVIAAAYTQRELKEKNINGVVIKSAGTDPSEEGSPKVIQYLKYQGFDIPHQSPRKVTEEDLSSAHKIISMGCDLKVFDKYTDKLLDWQDVPPTDQDIETSANIIAEKVEELVSSFGKKS